MPESAEQMTDNEALQQSVAVLRDILSCLVVRYDRVEQQRSSIAPGAVVTRTARASAVKTSVTVVSGGDVTLTEGGATVAILSAGKTWVSPATGASVITAYSIAGAVVEFATYIRQ